MSSTDILKGKARFLRNATPRAYDEFCEAFSAYATNASNMLLMAGENLQLHQGHAQQCAKLLAVFEEVRNG